MLKDNTRLNCFKDSLKTNTEYIIKIATILDKVWEDHPISKLNNTDLYFNIGKISDTLDDHFNLKFEICLHDKSYVYIGDVIECVNEDIIIVMDDYSDDLFEDISETVNSRLFEVYEKTHENKHKNNIDLQFKIILDILVEEWA